MKELHELVAESVSQYPNNVAVVFDSGEGEPSEQQRITYRQLWQQVTELKSAFESLCMKDQIVGVFLADGPSIPGILLGLLSSSCAFHPFNLEGLQYTVRALQKAGTSWILVHSELNEWLFSLLQQLKASEVSLDALSKISLKLFTVQSTPTTATSHVKSRNLAYCITTSGTTSLPKVVQVPHSCIVPNIVDLRNTFQLGPNDRVLLTSPLTFDPSIIDIFCALSSGACLIIVPSEIKCRVDKLLDVIHIRQAVTMLQATPTLIRNFAPSKVRQTIFGPSSSLRVVALGGERFPCSDCFRSWLSAGYEKIKFYNLYGITEVSCWASCQLVDVQALMGKDEPVPIGKALDQTLIKLVTSRREEEEEEEDGGTETGDEGDIWIGSSQRICFIDNEIYDSNQENSSSEFFERSEVLWRRTGDRGNLLPDGSIVCLGRRDDQVKRHGKRLNLEAIEMVCKEVSGVLDCCVLLDGPHLMTFIIPDLPRNEEVSLTEHSPAVAEIRDMLSSHDPGDTAESVDVADWASVLQRLKAHTEEHLPRHCIPDIFVRINGGLPLTLHGKLDKKALIQIGTREMSVCMGKEIDNAWSFSQELWKSSLSQPDVVIDRSDNFISVGGDSLAALRVINLLENMVGVKLPMLFDLLLNKDFGHFVQELRNCLNKAQSDIQSLRQAVTGNMIDSHNLAYVTSHSDVQGEVTHSDKKMWSNNLLHGTAKNSYSSKLKHKNPPHHVFQSKVAKLSDLSKSEMENVARYHELSHMPLTVQYHHGLEVPQKAHDSDTAADHTVVKNMKDNLLSSDSEVGTEDSFISAKLKRIVSRGNVWFNHTFLAAGMLQRKEVSGLRSESVVSISELVKLDAVDNSERQSTPRVMTGSLDLGENCGRSGTKCPSHKVKPVLELKLKWKVDTKKCVDASPLVVDGRDRVLAFIGSHSGQFSAINVLTGDCVWSISLPDRIESSACCSLCGSFIVVGCYDGSIYTLDAGSGSVVWKCVTEDAVKCSPVLNESTGHVVCGSHDGFLYCLDVRKQICIWKCHVGEGSVFSSPVIDTSSHLVYAASLSGKLSCFCSDSGMLKWRYELHKPVFSSLCLLGQSVLVGCVDGKLYCISSSGHVEWIFETKAPIFSTPVVYKTSVFIGCHDHCVYCISSNGQLVWTFQTSSTVYSTVFVFKLCKPEENLTDPCLDHQCGADCQEQPAGLVAAASTQGVLYVLNSQNGLVQAQVKLPAEVFSSPVIVDNCVIIGCRDNFVYCFEII